MTDDEMDAELDAIEAEEASDEALAEHGLSTGGAAGGVDDSRIEALIRAANERRGEGDSASARHLLYLVLEGGSADQRRVARNILADLDRD
jgi:sec-independent protein translocase protein TatC